jgi:hypothetical protein
VTEKDKDLWWALKVSLHRIPKTSGDLTMMTSAGRTE